MKLFILAFFCILCMIIYTTSSYSLCSINNNCLCNKNKLKNKLKHENKTNMTCGEVLQSSESNGENHLPQCNCHYVNTLKRSPQKEIRAYKTKKTVSSELMCMECTAAARHLNETVNENIKSMLSQTPLSDLDEKGVKSILYDACKNGFTNYRMKEQNKKTFLAHSMHPATTIPTSLDNKWHDELKTMCRNLVQHLDLATFYSTVVSGKPTIIDLFCKSSVFPYCKNIDCGNIDDDSKDFSIQVYVHYAED